MDVFGFQISRKKAPQGQAQRSVVAPPTDDGSTIVNSNASYYGGFAIDLEGSIKTDIDLIRRYRESAQYPECDSAIEDIVDEAIVDDPNQKQVSIILDELKMPDNIKEIFRQEFDKVLKLYRFEEKGHDIFRQWYVDGRISYQVIIDPEHPELGIQELRFIDPRKIRKIKNVQKDRDPMTGVEITVAVEEYYLYNDAGFNDNTTQGVKLPVDSVVYVTSGLLDSNTNLVLSHLHKAIKPVNQLKMMEDAIVIYRISRAPERRIFYIDVGNLPKQRAEQYVTDIMNKFRNKVVYDVKTGEVKDNKQHLSLMEDFWMPRRDGGKGTEIKTLDGAQNLSQIEDVIYFENKLYKSLNVPLGRMRPDQGFSLGKTDTISREEIKFNKFVGRLRKRFAKLFRDALRVQLVALSIIRPEEWEEIAEFIRFDYQKDNYFTELKQSEILNSRLALLEIADQYVGKYFSGMWVKKNILQQSEDEIEEMDKEMQFDLQMQVAYAEHEGEMELARAEPTMVLQAQHTQQAAKAKAKPGVKK